LNGGRARLIPIEFLGARQWGKGDGADSVVSKRLGNMAISRATPVASAATREQGDGTRLFGQIRCPRKAKFLSPSFQARIERRIQWPPL